MQTKRLITFVIVIGLLVWLGSSFQVKAAPPSQDPTSGASTATLLSRLKQAGDGPVRISYHNETGQVRFIGASPEQAVRQPAKLAAGASPETAARSFMNVYGKLFGLKDQATELAVMKQNAASRGRSLVRFQQKYRDIPVLGGEMVVQLNSSLDLVSAQGEILPDITLSTSPAINSVTARQNALEKVARDYNVSPDVLVASEPELWIYNPIIMGGPGLRRNTLVWRMEVTPKELLPIRELVLVDAQMGAIALNFNQIDTARNRLTYDANNTLALPGTLRCNESNPNCTGGDAHEVAAHHYAGDTYDYYAAEHGRDSIDNAGMALISTVHYDSGYYNAFWNGQQMVYGDGDDFPLADDVVGHELSHGVTEHESGLFYFYQSGAINESFSDLWGEFVDLTNGSGNDTAAARWLMGEDITGMGAIRNMKNPPAFGDPDRMGSSIYYCAQSGLGTGAGDAGGVHYNSGVNNKAVYLMTDGDTFNGVTVTGLGISKVADLYYEVQTNLLTSAMEYPDLYDALIQACSNLGYSASDCQEVQDALNAVQMNQQPAGCATTQAPLCDSAGTTPNNLFFDDIESGSGHWTSGVISGSNYWFVPQSIETLGLGSPYATSGVGNIWGFNQGYPYGSTSNTYLAMNSSVALPANAYLHFNHAFGFDSDASGATRYDGGIVEYSTNNGSSWVNAGSLFTNNGYNGTLASGNPLGTIQAFTADSRGYISSRLNLNSLAGQNVRFRFRIGTNNYTYDYGWFIDDVRIYTCSSSTQPTVQFSTDAYSVNEGAGTATITATLSEASSSTVTVHYATSNGTATAGSDYTAANGTLTFTPSQVSQTFTVPITNDTLDENNETVNLTLSSPTNATLGTPSTATLTITDDDNPPAVQFSSSTYNVDEAAGTATITVNLSAASSFQVGVNYATSNGTATAGQDYTTTGGTLTFTAGQTTRTFTVPITNDALDEPDETVSLTLSSPSNATLGSPNPATLTILDDDLPPTHGVSILPATDDKFGIAGATVTYTLHITNTGDTTDTFDISVSGASWTTDVPSTVGPLAADATIDIQVVVHIPGGTLGGTSDVATITATSQGDGTKTGSATLTTSVPRQEIYLPFISQN